MANSMYPLQVAIPDEKVAILQRLFAEAYKEIVGEIAGATDFSVKRRKAILTQIDGILTDLGTNVDEFLEKEMPEFYESGARDAIKQLENINAPLDIVQGFDVVHKETIRALIDDTSIAFQEAMAGVKRSADLLVGRATRELLTQKIATGLVTGDALREVRQTIKGVLAEQGLDALKDKSGRAWKLDTYADMLFRTQAVQARNYGMANRMVENGYDLVQVSQHFAACKLCQPWEGKILSVTGKTSGWPTLSEAINGGLFHPNCKHAINALIPKLATKTRAYDPNTQTLGPEAVSVEAPATEQLKKIVDKAVGYDPIFKQSIEEIANDLGLDFSHGSVKKPERMAQKVLRDYNGDPSKLKDTNRSAIFVSDPKQLNALIKSTTDIFEIDRVKNGFGQEGYQKAMINVKLPTGAIGEIQVTTPEMWKANKELGAHDLYDQIRIKADGWVELQAKMDKLYTDAADAMEKRLKNNG